MTSTPLSSIGIAIGLPFVSTRLTATPLAFPTKLGSGVNVTLPSLSTVYLPSPGIT